MGNLVTVNAWLAGFFALAAVHYAIQWWFSRHERVLLVFSIQCALYTVFCLAINCARPGDDDPRRPGRARPRHDPRRDPPRRAPAVLCGPGRSPRPCVPRARHGRARRPRRPEPWVPLRGTVLELQSDAAALRRHGPAADPHAPRRTPRRPVSRRAARSRYMDSSLPARSGSATDRARSSSPSAASAIVGRSLARDPRRLREAAGAVRRAPCRTRSSCSAWRSSSRGSTRRAARGWPPADETVRDRVRARSDREGPPRDGRTGSQGQPRALPHSRLDRRGDLRTSALRLFRDDDGSHRGGVPATARGRGPDLHRRETPCPEGGRPRLGAARRVGRPR